MNLLDTKAGKRVRGSMVDLLNDAIEALNAVMVWAKYEDSLEEDEKRTLSERSPTRGSIERSRSQLTTHSSGDWHSRANWSAKVGEIIIGNLMRGEGGRFASARNIGKVMRQLDDVGITPDMFVGMQNLLAGQGSTVSAGVLADLRSAGLINDQGVVQGKAYEIINAIKTGDPKNLAAVLKPSSGSGSGGGGGGGQSTEEKHAANIEKLRPDIVASTKLTDAMIDALVAFYNGENIDNAQIEGLVKLGLLAFDADKNLFMTTYGRSMVTSMQQGDLRKALDAYSRALNSVSDSSGTTETEKEKNTQKVSATLVQRGVLTSDQIKKLLGFDKGDTYNEVDVASLVQRGLLGMTGLGELYMTTRGQQVVTRMERGDLRATLDALNQAQQNAIDTRDSSKSTRADAAEALISSGTLSRGQADALIRTWVSAGGADKDAIAQLNRMGLMRGDALTGYGILVLSALDRGADDIATEFIQDAGSQKMFRGFKQLGSDYFLTWTTNAFKDREQEIFTTQALEDYVSRTDAKDAIDEPYDFFHIRGSEFATVQWQGGVGREIVEIGRYDDTPIGQAFKVFFNRFPDGHPDLAPYGWGCSHEYAYVPSDREDGVYDWFQKRKSTILPLQEAANPFTLAEFGLGEKNMELSKKQRAALVKISEEIGDPDLLDTIIQVGQERTALLERMSEFKANVCKTEDGVCYPAADYAYVPDRQKPSTWKLRLSQGKPGNITVTQLGRAAAALSKGGFRGNRVELPQDAIGKAKRKIRSHYHTLGVSDEEIPESVKGLKDETMNRSELSQKMADLTELMPEEKRAGWKKASDQLVEPDSDVAAIQRMIMEMLVDLPDETRTQAEELVTALAELAQPPEEPTEEPPADTEAGSTDEEMTMEPNIATEAQIPSEEVTMDREGEMKQLSEDLVGILHLNELSQMLETQAAGIKSAADAIDELTRKVETLASDMTDLREKTADTDAIKKDVAGVKEVVSGVKVQTDAIVSEKQRFVPFWANGVSNASVARETELNEADAKDYRKPEVPSAIAGIRNRVLRRD